MEAKQTRIRNDKTVLDAVPLPSWWGAVSSRIRPARPCQMGGDGWDMFTAPSPPPHPHYGSIEVEHTQPSVVHLPFPQEERHLGGCVLRVSPSLRPGNRLCPYVIWLGWENVLAALSAASPSLLSPLPEGAWCKQRHMAGLLTPLAWPAAAAAAGRAAPEPRAFMDPSGPVTDCVTHQLSGSPGPNPSTGDAEGGPNLGPSACQ